MTQLKGVNLGGWLVLERWITPSLFQGLNAKDEKTFCQELGANKQAVLKDHRDSYINESDFQWMTEHGINAARIPVGHWILEDAGPFVSAVKYLDKAFVWAQSNGISILIDLHTAPGSQNGHDHSGEAGPVGWHKDADNIQQTLHVIEGLAARYGKNQALLGIELLNEPDKLIPHDLLLEFYKDAYELVRRYCGREKAVVISDAYRPLDWQGAMPAPRYDNVWLDTHHYQVFGFEDKRRDIHAHLRHARQEQKKRLTEMQKHLPIIVGEWSLGLPSRALKSLEEYEKDKALQAYAAAQLEAFGDMEAYFFWTYKTEDKAGWSLQEAVRRGWVSFTE